jgi:hypothetical protein
MNILEYIPRLHVTEYTRYLAPPLCPAMCPYISQLTEEYSAICSLVNRGISWFFYITHVLAAYSDGEPPK